MYQIHPHWLPGKKPDSRPVPATIPPTSVIPRAPEEESDLLGLEHGPPVGVEAGGREVGGGVGRPDQRVEVRLPRGGAGPQSKRRGGGMGGPRGGGGRTEPPPPPIRESGRNYAVQSGRVPYAVGLDPQCGGWSAGPSHPLQMRGKKFARRGEFGGDGENRHSHAIRSGREPDRHSSFLDGVLPSPLRTHAPITK